LGAFLLVLVGTPVAPWKVLDKKVKLFFTAVYKGERADAPSRTWQIRAASDQLRGPLETVAA
jgi:hypothetical protein